MPLSWYLGTAWALVVALTLSPGAALSERAAVEGTDDNWDDVVTSSPLVLVGFFAPCKHPRLAIKHASPPDKYFLFLNF